MPTALSPPAKEQLIRHSVDVFTVLDDSGVIQYESPSFSRTFGYDPDEFVGESVFDFVHPDDRPHVRDAFEELVAATTEYTTECVELRFRHKENGWIWIESRGANKAGSEIGGYVITSREITERKKFEQQLKQERDRIEQFASFVSHDLRNPLRGFSISVDVVNEILASTLPSHYWPF